MIVPVVLSGGSGTILWPLSRALRPMQLLSLNNDMSMIQQIVWRLNRLKILAPPIIACNKASAEIATLTEEQLTDDSVQFVIPADYIVQHKLVFHKIIEKPHLSVKCNKPVIFDVIKKSSDTNCRYIACLRSQNILFQFISKLFLLLKIQIIKKDCESIIYSPRWERERGNCSSL